MDDKAASELLQHYYEPCKRHMDARSAEFDKYEMAYFGESEVLTKPTGEDDWKSHVLYKHAMQQTQTAVAEIVPEDDPGFDWDTDNPEQEDYANIVEAIVNRDFAKDDYAEKKFLSALGACIYGEYPVWVSWQSRRERYIELTPNGPKVAYRIGCDQPTATLLDPRDFFRDMRARRLKDARFAGKRMRVSLEELEAAERPDGTKLYKRLEELRDIVESQESEQTQTFDNDNSGEIAAARRKGIEVIEMWTHDRVIARACGLIIRNDERTDPINGLPCELIRILPSLVDPGGMSLMQLVRDPQEHLWSLRNGALNGLKLMLDPPRSIDIMSDPDNADKVWKPGQTYTTTMAAKDAVELLRVSGIDPLVSQTAIASEQDVMEYITGITRGVSGAENASTATVGALNSRASRGRIGKMIASVNRSWCNVAKMFLLLDQAFMDYSKPVKILGPKGKEWVHVSPQMIGGDWNPTPKASSNDAIKELSKQNVLEMLNTLMPLNGFVSPGGKAIDWTPLVVKLAELEGLNAAEVIVDAASLFESQRAQTLAQASAQSEAMAMQQPPPEESPPNMVEGAQARLYETINYKDLPNDAQRAMLESIGLPSTGVTQDDKNLAVQAERSSGSVTE